MIKKYFSSLLYALFPRRCDLCGEVVPLDCKRCDKCLANERIIGDICDSCGCAKGDCCCDKKKAEYKCIVAPFYFKDNVAFAIHRLKFFSFPELSVAMGKEIYNTIVQRYDDVNFDCVTFVPLSKKRQRKRGYNQSELLAKTVADNLGIKCENYLLKVYDNSPQRSQNAKQRKINVFGVYDLQDDVNVKNKTILLVDDVKTTGSTLNECAKVLKGYGAKSVYACSFAVAKRKK